MIDRIRQDSTASYASINTTGATRSIFLCLLAAHLSLVLAPIESSAQPSQRIVPERVARVLDTYDRMATKALWPGFEPRNVPIAIYDGTSSWLVRHPAPPAGWKRLPHADDVAVFGGQHETIRANTSTDIGGLTTAVAILEGRKERAQRLAALLIHEAFHVYQRMRHPGWAANEVELLEYPTDDSVALALRRLETKALRMSLRSGTEEQRRAWSQTATELRRERFATLPKGAVDYERRTELSEGIARYVERLAAGQSKQGRIPEGTFPPEAVRERAYATGEALALLLDEFHPTWKEQLVADTTARLDVLLSDALSAAEKTTHLNARFTPRDRRAAIAVASDDIRSLKHRRREALASFLDRPGWSIEIVADENLPLWPNNFDPLNILKIDSVTVLHTRWISVGNEIGTVEVLGDSALSLSASSEHPLFAGLAKLVISGLDDEPDILENDGVLSLEAPPMKFRFDAGSVEQRNQRLIVRLPGATKKDAGDSGH